MHRNKYRAKENEETREYVGNKRTRKTPETIKKICDLLNKEFKITVIKMLTEIRRTTYEQGKFQQKDRKYRKIPNGKITELKNTTK